MLSVKRLRAMNADMLRIFRDGGAQHYPIKRATWGFSQPLPYSVPVLALAVEAEKQASIFPEDDSWPHKPRWCLDVWLRGLNDHMLLPGSQFSIPNCYDDFTGVVYTIFYYDEHEGTERNAIKIVRRTNDFLDLAIEGHISHANASMPRTRITVDARFTKLTPHQEIQAQFCRKALPPHDPPYAAEYSPPSTA
jgi:hypothetical protein